MNRILSGDRIKALAVTILDDQNSGEFYACQDGTTLIQIRIKNSEFKIIPYRTLFFVEGKLEENFNDEKFTINVDLENNQDRFVSFNPNTIRLYQGMKSVFDVLESLPNLSDTKPFPGRHEFENLYLFLLDRQAQKVKIIRDELDCGDFGDQVPKYIRGIAYEKMFLDWTQKMKNQKNTFKLIPNRQSVIKKRIIRKTKTPNSEAKNQIVPKPSNKKSNKKVITKLYSVSNFVFQIPKRQDADGSIHNSESSRLESDSSDGSEIVVNRYRKKRKRNPFLDDEAEDDGPCSDDDNDGYSDAELSDFIDDSGDFTENNFTKNKKVEIEVNKENLLKFLNGQTKQELEHMGLVFVYSHPQDLFK